MSSNCMLLKSCRVSKKAKAVTSSTPVKEKANSVVHSCLNDRHGSAKDWQKIENAEFLISNLQSLLLWPFFMDGAQMPQGYRATMKRQLTFYQ